MIIKGTVLPIGVINKNRWGIPDEPDVINSTIKSLQSSKVKICPSCSGQNEHHCDYTDTGLEIGEIVEVYRNEDAIDAIVKITSQDAIDNFKSGKWGNTWSPFGTYESMDESGFIHGKYENKYLTFVNQPAWDDSKNNQIFASENKSLRSYCELTGNDEFISEPSISESNLEDETDIVFASSFDSSSLNNSDFDNFGDNMKDSNDNINNDINQSENDDNIDYKELYEQEHEKYESMFESLNEKMNNMEEKYKSSFEKTEEPENNEANMDINPDGVPEDTVRMLIENAIVNERESIQKNYTIDNYKNICKSIGLDVKDSDLERFKDQRFKSEDIEREINIIKSVASKSGIQINNSKEPQYHNKEEKKEENKNGLTVGKWNHKTKQYDI